MLNRSMEPIFKYLHADTPEVAMSFLKSVAAKAVQRSKLHFYWFE
jgi:hypothetical protein